jgi:hypothetical protein
MRRFLILTTGLLLGGLLFAEPTQAQCGLFGGNGLFGRRARAESYSAGYGAACYGQSYVGAIYATAGPRPFSPIRNLLGGRRVAVVAQPYVPTGYAVGGYAGGAPGGRFVWSPASGQWIYVMEDVNTYINPGSANYPPSWQAACVNGVCPMPPTPGKATPQAPSVPPPAPLPPPSPAPALPHTGDPHHSKGNGCTCGDPKCTHGIGICECDNPKCICPEHKHRGKFPR